MSPEKRATLALEGGWGANANGCHYVRRGGDFMWAHPAEMQPDDEDCSFMNDDDFQQCVTRAMRSRDWLEGEEALAKVRERYTRETAKGVREFAAAVMANSIFEHIKHGDEAHQKWLREATLAWASKWCEASR